MFRTRAYSLFVSFITLLSSTTFGIEVTVDRIKNANEANRLALKSLVVKERVKQTFNEAPGRDQEQKAAMIRAWTEERDRALRRAVQRGVSQKVAAGLHQSFARKLVTADRSILVRNLNKRLTLERTRTVDVAKQLVRLDDKDMRDLQRIVAANNLDHEARRDLDRTRTTILSIDNTVYIYPKEHSLAVILPIRVLNMQRECLSYGVMPEEMVTDPAYVMEVNSADHQTMELSGLQNGRLRFKAALRVDLNFRLSHWVTLSEDGSVSDEVILSDYRFVDGIPIPFKTIVRHNRDGVQDFNRTESVVDTVDVNVPIGPEVFKIPPGYRVQDMTKSDAEE